MCVTTSVVFVTAVYITIYWPQTTLGVEILWQILIVGFLGSLGIFIYPEREISRKMTLILCVLHYLETNALVLGCGIWFEWFEADNLFMVLGMVIAITVVFLLVTVIEWKKNNRMAAIMNERLKEYQNLK